MMNATKKSRASSEAANRIYQELTEHSVATLATVGADGLPDLAAIYYLVDENFTIGFATKKKTNKHRNLSRVGDVQMLVHDEKHQLTIKIAGQAHEVVDSDLESKIIEEMYWKANAIEHHAPPITKLLAGDFVVYQILPRRITMASFLHPQKRGYDMFETVTFDD